MPSLSLHVRSASRLQSGGLRFCHRHDRGVCCPRRRGSRLVERVSLLRKKASRTRFSTVEAEADNTIRISAEKGKIQLGKLNVTPHEFIPMNEAIPTPLLPNKALNHGVRAKARQIRVNRYRRSLGEIRREKRLVIAGRVSQQRAVNPT